MITKYGHRHFNDVDGDVWEDEPEPEPTYICYCCNRGIYEGEEFYTIEQMTYCQNCVRHRSGDIFKITGGEAYDYKPPVCEFCKEEIQGKYIRLGCHRYCNDCLTDFGKEVIEDAFCVEPEDAGEPEKWEEG